MGFAAPATAPPSVLPPPLATVYPTSISNDEIFYLGGTVTQGEGIVVVYLQSEDGGIISREVKADPQGAWFYSHPTFLKRGSYRVWTQLRVGESASPPSAEIRVEVVPTAFQFGSLRMSFETFYLFIALLLGAVILLLVALIIHHSRQGEIKRRRLDKEISEAEAAVRRGFATLHQDITSELEVVRRMKSSRELSVEERSREEKLLKDLGLVEAYVTREVADIEKAAAA